MKDAQLIFNAVWEEIENEFGRENLRFPKEFFWLNGAPGAGKGTQTEFIRKFRDLTAPPIVMSGLLKSPEAQKLIDAGKMVGDREVIGILFKQLLNPIYESGALIDGFPRTLVQVLCLRLLYDKLVSLRNEYLTTPYESHFPKPVFHIVVLFIDEGESVRRQVSRGEKAIEHNRQVELSGVGELIEVRNTDTEKDYARSRYQTFKSLTYDSLKLLRKVFQYHFIDAQGSIEEVQNRIVRELAYQSSLELDQTTLDIVSSIPLASDVVLHARQDLVKRLEDYAGHHTELFKHVVEIIDQKMMPIVRRHSISGMARISTEDHTFDNPLATAMLIDVFSERGYQATVDIRREYVPVRVDLKTGDINVIAKKVYRVHVRFARGEIHRSR